MSSLFGCAGQFVSYLVTNPKDRFSRAEARMITSQEPLKWWDDCAGDIKSDKKYKM